MSPLRFEGHAPVQAQHTVIRRMGSGSAPVPLPGMSQAFLSARSRTFGGIIVESRPDMPCEEKARLVAAHHLAAVVYSRAAIARNRSKQTSPYSEYERLCRAANDARIKCKETHRAFERHVAEHGC